MVEKFKAFIQDLDDREFYRYLAVFLAALVLIMGGIVFFNYRTTAQLKKRITRLNNNRHALQEILTTFERVKQQKADVAAILEKDKTFKIVGYLDQLIGTLNLTQHRAGLQQSEESLEHLSEYNEIKLIVSFADMNMRQLVELLREIEKNERIYIKELEITKSGGRPAIDVRLTIATLQART